MKKKFERGNMASRQSVLDKWFLRQDIINQLLESGEESEEALKFAERIMPVVEAEESEYQSLEDPFDRSVALVLSLVKDQELNPWDVDLSTFLKVFTKRVRLESDKLNLPACGRLIRMSWEVLNQQAIVLFDRVQNMDQEEDWEDEEIEIEIKKRKIILKINDRSPGPPTPCSWTRPVPYPGQRVDHATVNADWGIS